MREEKLVQPKLKGSLSPGSVQTPSRPPYPSFGRVTDVSSGQPPPNARPRKVPTCRLLACQTSTTDPSRSVPLGGGSIRGGEGAAGLEGDWPLPGDAARRGPRTAAGQRGCVERGGAKRGVVRLTQRSRFASIEPAVRPSWWQRRASPGELG